MPKVTSNGTSLHYEVHGEEGEPLLLVMGLGGQLSDWPDGFIDQLVVRGYRVITPDNRDSGLSTQFSMEPPTVWQLAKAILFRQTLPHEYLLGDMAADLIGLLDELGIERAHVVGMSMGGMIAQTLAATYPARFVSLTSIMSTTGNPKVGRAELSLLFYMARTRGRSRDEAVDVAVETFRRLSGPEFDEAAFRAQAEASVARSFTPEGTARQLAAILASGDRTAELARIDIPSLVIHGALDPLVAPSGGVATARAIAGARLVMYPDMGHNLPESLWSSIVGEIDILAGEASRSATE